MTSLHHLVRPSLRISRASAVQLRFYARPRRSQPPSANSAVTGSAATVPSSYKNPFANIPPSSAKPWQDEKLLVEEETPNVLGGGAIRPKDDLFFAKLIAASPHYRAHFEPFLASQVFEHIRQNAFVLEKLYAYVSYGHRNGYIIPDPTVDSWRQRIKLWKWSKSNGVYTAYIELLREIHEEGIDCSEDDLKLISNLLVNCD